MPRFGLLSDISISVKWIWCWIWRQRPQPPHGCVGRFNSYYLDILWDLLFRLFFFWCFRIMSLFSGLLLSNWFFLHLPSLHWPNRYLSSALCFWALIYQYIYIYNIIKLLYLHKWREVRITGIHNWKNTWILQHPQKILCLIEASRMIDYPG